MYWCYIPIYRYRRELGTHCVCYCLAGSEFSVYRSEENCYMKGKMKRMEKSLAVVSTIIEADIHFLYCSNSVSNSIFVTRKIEVDSSSFSLFSKLRTTRNNQIFREAQQIWFLSKKKKKFLLWFYDLFHYFPFK